MKIDLLVNLENFQNIHFISNDDKERLDGYEEILPYVEDWVEYSPFALKLANHIRKILNLDPYEVENDGLEVVNEVEIKKQPFATGMIMDLKEVTVMAKTDLSLLVTKKGYQKWVAFSLMIGISKDDYEPGEYIEDIQIIDDKRVWFNEKKSWEILKVAKK